MKNWLCTQMVLRAPLPFIALNRKLRPLLPRLLFCVLIFSSIGFYTTPAAAQTSPLSFNQIPFSDPDLVAPGRGVEHWFDNSNFNNTTTVQVPAGNVRALDFYYRINWAQLEGATEGSYKWSLFDQLINSAIDNGQKFNFGILPMCEGYAPFGQVNGANLSYPTYIHTKMQAEATPDWIYSGDPCWVPNWNSEAYLSALENLYKAVANHIANGSYKGVPYKNVIGYIDVRGYGNFGEWHTYPWDDGRFTAPVNARATSATLKRIIDAHINAFPNYQLVLNVAVWMEGASSYMPGDVGAYAANASNAYGKLGWRRDNWGQDFRDDEYYNNPYSYNGLRFDTVIRNRWKYAPIIGEPNTSTSSTPNYGDLPREIRLYHTNSFGNGNYFGGTGISSQATKDSIIAASKACGYRLILEGGNMTTTLSGGLPFSISLNWKNVGVAPTYEHWNVTYELRNSSNVAVWTGNSSFQPYLFLPAATAQVATDNFTLPANISPGTYSMVLVVRDPNGYRKPLPLAIKGRAADGSYLLRTVVVGAANQMPVADAGPDLVTTNSLADLDGSATYDPDGNIASFKWTKIAGPGIYTISSTSTATPSLTGLVVGDYTFQLEATDNMGAKSRDTVNITSVATVLPVQWLYVKAEPANDGNLISWATGTELNNVQFEVERSYDGKLFNSISTVKGAGTSANAQHYQYKDIIGNDQTLYYRIRQLSADGSSSYSEMVVVRSRNDAAGRLDIYPNPAQDYINISLQDPATGLLHVTLYSLDGKKLWQQNEVKSNKQLNTSVSLQNLQPGMYMLQVELGDQIKEIRKIIKK